jgi:anti-sigma factor RsiW
MTEHPDLFLSAFLDDGLTQSEHAGVRAHLDGCPRCRGRLAELRATSRLIGALPTLTPGRSLVPRLDRAPVWLRPVRLLGAMGSGLFVFLFMASAIVHTGSSLGGGAGSAARGQFGTAANAPAADPAKRLDDSASAAPTGAPAPAVQLPPSFDASRGSLASASSPTPFARAESASTAAGTATEALRDRPPFGPPPQVFLGLAAFCAIAALVAHRRLRRS